jgi:hypothetical protein
MLAEFGIYADCACWGRMVECFGRLFGGPFEQRLVCWGSYND